MHFIEFVMHHVLCITEEDNSIQQETADAGVYTSKSASMF